MHAFMRVGFIGYLHASTDHFSRTRSHMHLIVYVRQIGLTNLSIIDLKFYLNRVFIGHTYATLQAEKADILRQAIPTEC